MCTGAGKPHGLAAPPGPSSRRFQFWISMLRQVQPQNNDGSLSAKVKSLGAVTPAVGGFYCPTTLDWSRSEPAARIMGGKQGPPRPMFCSKLDRKMGCSELSRREPPCLHLCWCCNQRVHPAFQLGAENGSAWGVADPVALPSRSGMQMAPPCYPWEQSRLWPHACRNIAANIRVTHTLPHWPS